jgi:hypothetical protein
VPSRTGLSPGPVTPHNTLRANGAASGRVSKGRRAVAPASPKQARAGGTRKANPRERAYCQRVTGAPRRTASVCLPTARSVSMSRRLFATRMAVTNKPTGNEMASARASTKPVCK